ncbi:MAG: polysaccharide deacetylase family protein [Clostridiales bacterium]|nr:polysaccharide deacetylase family protein [Clostridiales bacterium]
MFIILNKKILQMIIVIFLITIIILTGILIHNSKKEVYTSLQENKNYNIIQQGSDTSNYIAFACNVDWGNEVIPDMLEVFKSNDIKITFFVTGRWAEEFPDIFKMIIDEGHEIGNHGYKHLNYSQLSYEENKKQIHMAGDIIKKYTNTQPTLFAPPSGDYNENTLRAAEELGYKTILWTIDTIDWRDDSTKDVIIDRVMNKTKHNGAIVLMHPTVETLKAIPSIINQLHEKNIKVGGISDVLLD